MRTLIFVALTLIVTACAINTQVTRSSQKSFAAKPSTCNIEFFRTQRPAVPYDEIGAIHLAGSVLETAADAQEALRKQACELGADAVVVTDEVYQVPNVGLRVTATAIAYRAQTDVTALPEGRPHFSGVTGIESTPDDGAPVAADAGAGVQPGADAGTR